MTLHLQDYPRAMLKLSAIAELNRPLPNQDRSEYLPDSFHVKCLPAKKSTTWIYCFFENLSECWNAEEAYFCLVFFQF